MAEWTLSLMHYLANEHCVKQREYVHYAVVRNVEITCSTVVLPCYRRQAITMEQAKIRPSVTL